MFQNRNEVENQLRVAVSKLSRATSANELVRMLQVSAFSDRQDVAHHVLKYLTQAQKVSHLENSELASLYASLVVVRFHSSIQNMSKFLKTIEYLLLRRIHTMDANDLSKICYSYSQLMKQNKINTGSISVIKTMEYMIQNNWNQF